MEVVNQNVSDYYALYHGDCIDIARGIPDNSIHYTIFSPPFSSLYTYSNSERDMGNCKGDTEFFAHFKYLVNELFRIAMPGRLVSFHCMNLPTSKERDGYIGIRDFRGDLIRLFESCGFIFHSEVVIWKDPLIAATRTKALGLMHKQICKDSALCRQGIPDYLITMRKLGENPEPVNHPKGFEEYIGEDNEPREYFDEDQRKNKYSHIIWQRYASPVWMDINPTRTLQYMHARDGNDERHICPLQLDVIERAIHLWTNKGDIVFSPFGGIGSEPYSAIKMGRIGVAAELKESYYGIMVENCKKAVHELGNIDLVAMMESEGVI